MAILSTGDELRPAGDALAPGPSTIQPAMLAALRRPWIRTVASLRAEDRVERLAAMLRDLAEDTDVILSSGGAASSDTDPGAGDPRRGGLATTHLALKPGKPIVLNRLGTAAVLALPGNPVAAMVNFLLFGRAMLLARAGVIRRGRAPAGGRRRDNRVRGRTGFAGPGHWLRE